MKLYKIFFLLYFLFGLKSGFGQTVIQSSCASVSSEYNAGIEEFTFNVAISEMMREDHYLNDSILVPKVFLDSIRQLVNAYHNAIGLTDSIVDYRNFNDSKLEWGTIYLTFDNLSNCVTQQNDSIAIKNELLAGYIDSLALDVLIEDENRVALYDTKNRANMYGDFNFFYNVSCISKVELIFRVADQGLCYTSRSGVFRDSKLYLKFTDVNYCESNSYYHKWNYSVTNDCKIEILDISTNNINSSIEDNMVIYPNPFDDRIYFETNRSVKRVKLLGMNGKIYGESVNDNPQYLETPNLPSGVYIIELKFENGNRSSKILIKK